MAVRFIRRPSETPSITNFDDARSIRYAYGGQDGFVQKAGNELSPTVIGSIFKINSGVVVLQGWESEIDSNGWTMTVDNIATKRYYSVYYEVNLAAQTTEIKAVYDTAGYPLIDAGDDLTEFQTGTARLLLYQFTAVNGEISDVDKKVNAILFVTLVSNRPPIMAISVPELFHIDKTLTDPKYHSGELLLEKNSYSGVIGYSPKDSNNSIRSVKITQLNLDGSPYTGNIRYTMDSNGQFIPVGFGDKPAYLEFHSDVKVEITDIYGNVHNISWRAEAI